MMVIVMYVDGGEDGDCDGSSGCVLSDMSCGGHLN